jgi:hypothetical protein
MIIGPEKFKLMRARFASSACGVTAGVESVTIGVRRRRELFVRPDCAFALGCPSINGDEQLLIRELPKNRRRTEVFVSF